MNARNLEKLVTALNAGKGADSIGTKALGGLGLSPDEASFLRAHNPQKALIVYGTLAPGKPNHKVVSHINGEWKRAVIRGRLENKGWGAELGFGGFVHTDGADRAEIACHVLVSDELPANWALLDEFEGDGYERVLAVYETPDGAAGVGYIYAVAAG